MHHFRKTTYKNQHPNFNTLNLHKNFMDAYISHSMLMHKLLFFRKCNIYFVIFKVNNRILIVTFN